MDKITPEMLPLASLTQVEIDQIVAQVPGGISNIQDIYALSSLQEGMLFHRLLDEGDDPYISIATLKFDNKDVLERYVRALQYSIDRHDSLRTAVIYEGLQEPVQVIWRKADLRVERIVLDINENEGYSDLEIIKLEKIQKYGQKQGLILEEAPLIRLVVSECENGEYLGALVLHHLISDHVSLEILQREAQATEEERNHFKPAVPFRNLIAEHRRKDRQASSIQFFRNMLGDVTEPVLAFGLSDIHLDGLETTEHRMMFNSDLNNRLRAQANRLGVSLASLCHLGWAQVVSHCSGCEQVVFGTVLLGRSGIDSEDLV
ncbi:condensation domain-containing protein, partial [Acinetobacter vivianii]